jgi:hypothetical protein
MKDDIRRIEGFNEDFIETDWATLNKENLGESFQYLGNRFADNFKVYALFEGRKSFKAVEIE